MFPAIQVARLSKCYDIRHESREKYLALRDVLASRFRSLLSRRQSSSPESVEQFWALKDVSFEVNPGDRIGIIGRNGAGKSTLLKLLSRITEPTKGRIAIAGRVASLLEVGTGFHPELTGRENIYLNGVIIGMKRSEVRRRFDEIVAFAEIERFLDTPVKRYSSGMYVRLAFAVAAHLEAEILIVDEVLAVGDAAFQEKCLSKMRSVTTSGRTVLFVSHNMAAIKHLCQRSMLLERGAVVHDGPTAGTVEEYERRNLGSAGEAAAWERSGSGRLRLESIRVEDAARPGNPAIPFGGSAEITLKGRVGPTRTRFAIAFQVMTASGLPVLFSYDQFREFEAEPDSGFEFRATIPQLRLMPDVYFLNVWMGKTGVEDLDYVRYAASFEILQTTDIRITMPVNQSFGFMILDADVRRIS